MRKILGFGAALAAACLAGTSGSAYGQAGEGNPATGGPAGVSGRIHSTSPSTLVTAPNNLQEKETEDAARQAAGANAAAPGQRSALTTMPGAATTPANAAQGPGTTAGRANAAGTGNPGGIGNRSGIGNPGGIGNPSGIGNAGGVADPGAANQGYAGNATSTTATPNTTSPFPPGTPGEWNYQANPANGYAPGVQRGYYPGTATAATPGYTGRVMPGMAGYNGVNPMGTTMAPSYYYAGTAGMPYATYNQTSAGNSPYGYGATTAYPSTYAPGTYVGGAPGYVVQRRGLFGRRSRVVYPAGSYTYRSYPSGYSTYGTTTYYSTPGTYNYGNTTYTTPGNYTNGAYPY